LIKTLDIKINIKNKNKIGEDRIVNAYYAKKRYSKNLIIIDFGTATTFDVIDSKGNYDGGIITPGIDLSLKVLSEKTAKLPLVKFAKTKNVIGRDTKSAIQSGFFWGYVSMVQGLIKNISREKKNSFRIILTGGNCNIFKSLIENVTVSDDLFNSKGLNFIMNEYLKK
jgi:type III pantothenate kinase